MTLTSVEAISKAYSIVNKVLIIVFLGALAVDVYLWADEAASSTCQAIYNVSSGVAIGFCASLCIYILVWIILLGLYFTGFISRQEEEGSQNGDIEVYVIR